MLKVLNKGFFLAEILILITAALFLTNIVANIKISYSDFSLKYSAKVLILHIQKLSELAVSKGEVILLNIDAVNDKVVLSSEQIPEMLILKDVLFKSNHKDIYIYPEGNISPVTIFLSKNNISYKLTVSAHHIPIFSLYKNVNGSWQKL